MKQLTIPILFASALSAQDKNFFAEVWNFRTNKPKADHQMGAFKIFGCEMRLC